jgi:hypothetical protein
MPDIADQLDAAIGHAPPDGPALDQTLDQTLDRTLALGRRALRRRRLAYGVGAVATALVIGGTAWAVSPGDSAATRSEDPGFGDRSANATPSQPTRAADDDGADPAGEVPWVGPDAARLDRRGELEIRPGWTMVRRIDEVNGPGTVGLEVTKGDRRQWFLFGTGMTISSLHAPSEGYATFQEWVDINGPLIEGANGGGDDDTDGAGDWPGEPRDDLVRFVPRHVSSARGLVAVSDDVTVVDQVYNPEIGDSFAPPADTGAAEVRKGDRSFYVVARRPDDVIAVPTDVAARKYGIDDLEAFLDFARDRYAEGGGGLL